VDDTIRYERGTLSPDQIRQELTDFAAATKSDPRLAQEALDVGTPPSDIDERVSELSVDTKPGTGGEVVEIIIAGAQLALQLWTEVIHPWIIRRRTRDALGKRIK
jgi:hypothetical protein